MKFLPKRSTGRVLHLAMLAFACAMALQPDTALAALSHEIKDVAIGMCDGSSFALAKERSKQLCVMASYTDGHLEAYEGAVDWSVDEPNLAEILPDGRITARGAGQVTVRVNMREGGLSAQQAIQVNEDPIRIFFKAPSAWRQPHLWVWYLRGRAHPSGMDDKGQPLGTVPPEGFAGGWPGPAMQLVAGAPGWFSYDVPRYDSPYLREKNLRKQPFWVIFNNPATQEKGAENLRDGGCFVADGAVGYGDMTGRWMSDQDCFVALRPLHLVAEPQGGPFYGESLNVRFYAEGPDGTSLDYAVDAEPAQSSAKPGPQHLQQGATPQTITLGADLAPGSQVTLCLKGQGGQGRTLSQCYSYRKMGSLPDIKGPGADYHDGYTTFTIWSPERRSVSLWLDGRTMAMGYVGDGVEGYRELYSLTVAGDYHLRPYHFLVDSRTVRDPYAAMVNPGTDFNIVMNMAAITPDGGMSPPPFLANREAAVIYEANVRDFTIHASSGVSPSSARGTFRGLTARGTHLVDERGATDRSVKTGLDHLVELGVTHVQLMPVFDYGSCSAKDPDNAVDCYNWGYDPENFNIPEERYSAFGPKQYEERVREFKTMVNELHKAGIRVIMDVVYNHTWTRPWRDQDEGERYFSGITGQYFLHDSRGRLVDLTGTGNTLNASHPMVNRYIRDSLEFWVREYGVDGFRFDLAGSFDKEVLEGWSAYLDAAFPGRTFLLYGEPWVANPDRDTWENHLRLQNLASMQEQGAGGAVYFGAFNDVFRTAIKGESDGASGAFAFNETKVIWPVAHGLRGSVLYGDGDVRADESIFARDPAQTINYASAHDNLTLWDKIDLWSSAKGAVPIAYKKRIQMFLNGMVLTAQGIPFLFGGEEMARTKFGVKNSYASPDQINQIDWNRKRDFSDTFAYYRQLIAMRRAHPALRLSSREEINARVSVVACDPSRSFVALAIAKGASPRQSEEFLLLYNSGVPFDYPLPPGSWRVAMRDGGVSPIGREEVVQGTIRVDGTAVTALFR